MTKMAKLIVEKKKDKKKNKRNMMKKNKKLKKSLNNRVIEYWVTVNCVWSIICYGKNN